MPYYSCFLTALLCERVEEERMGLWRKEVTEEAKKQLWLAAPVIFVSVSQFSLQMISVMFVGHLSELFLASVSLSTSMVNTTGFNVMVSSHHFVLKIKHYYAVFFFFFFFFLLLIYNANLFD